MLNIEAPVTDTFTVAPPHRMTQDDVVTGQSLTVSSSLSRDQRRAFTKMKVGTLMNLDLPPQVFVVEGLLPSGLVMLAGAPKLGKSWFSLDLAISVASGNKFMGRETKQGDVLFLALEDLPRRLQQRLNLVAPGFEWDDLPLEIWTEIEAMDEGGLEALAGWIKAAANPRLIVIDIWGRFEPRTPTSKNEYAHITQTMQKLQALLAENDIALLLIHHTRKSSGDAGPSGDPFDQVIGSRALTSNMDATIMLTRTRMQQDATLDITGRDIEESRIAVTFDRESYRWNETSKPSDPIFSPERQQILDAVQAGMTNPTVIAEGLGKGRTAVHNHLSGLVADGALERASKGNYRLRSVVTAMEALVHGEEQAADVTDIADMEDEEDLNDGSALV